MIVYGWNSKNITEAPLENYECPNCQEKKSYLAVFANYIHLFWIPLFPYKKTTQIFCTNCQLVTEEKEVPDDLKSKLKQLKSAVSIPKYLFSGLILIALGVGYLTYINIQRADLTQQYLDSPQIGDIYILKDLEEPSDYNHYLLKVNDILDDTLFVAVSSYSYNGIVDKLDLADGFYDFIYSMHKNSIREYDESGELKKIIRDYNSSAGFDRVIEYNELDTLNVD